VKVALVHDYLKEPGGAEAVLSVLNEMFPEAPIYTAFAFPEFWGRQAERMRKWRIVESFGKYLPFLPRFLSYYTLLSPLFFKSMDLSDYDLVIISQTGGYFPNGVKTGSKTKVLTYCHTPPRFLYGYDTATKERYKWYWRPWSEIANHILRMVDFQFAQKPNVFVANSRNVANRIRKFYRREAEVVYPPIEIAEHKPGIGTGKKNYFLIVSRIVGSKNIELAVEASNKFGFELKVAGKPIGENGRRIAEGITGPNVQYLGEVDEAEKIKLLSEAKAFLALERDADFGMTAVEPQAYGTPVIAFRNGGYLEAVVENKTGIFFDDLSAEAIGKAVSEFNKLKWNPDVMVKNSKAFSKNRFKEDITAIVKKTVN
jgi:glycosyltransferase involved in cell wall biosynthesis